MLNADGNKNRIKINRSNQRKKNKLARKAHFFVHFFAIVFHDLNVKLPGYLYYFKVELSCVLTKKFCYLVPVHFYFFRAAHFHIASH